MRATILTLGLAFLLASCGYAEWREAQKAEEKARGYVPEPTYCYQTIGEVACFVTPYRRDDRRIVNYFGPSPSIYPKPAPPPPPVFSAPAMTNYWVKDAEPVPLPAQPMQPASAGLKRPPVTRVPLN